METVGATLDRIAQTSQTQKREPVTNTEYPLRSLADSNSLRVLYNAIEAEEENLIDSGYPPPPPLICMYCRNMLSAIGRINISSMVSTAIPRKIQQWTGFEQCSCPQAAAHRAELEAEGRRQAVERLEAERMAEFNWKVRKIVDDSGLQARFKVRRFDTYQLSSDNEAAYQKAKQYAENFSDKLPVKQENGIASPKTGDKNGLFFVGSVGTGKTHLSAAIANELMSKGTPVICMTMIDLLAQIKRTFARRDEVISEDDIISIYKTVPLLIIDDLGKEQPSEWAIKTIYTIINARYESYMPVVITTNYTSTELLRRMTPQYGDDKTAEATLDRLYETCEAVPMFWKSWRIN